MGYVVAAKRFARPLLCFNPALCIPSFQFLSCAEAASTLTAMTSENWHDEFNPRKFLSRVNLAKLIENNQAYNESFVVHFESICILCDNYESDGLILNDKSFICERCFCRVATISYPKKYETRRREYLTNKEARRLAWESFKSTYEYNSQNGNMVFFGWASILLALLHPSFLLLTITLLVIGYTQQNADEQRCKAWINQKTAWEQDNPEPQEPELKHFHDPTVELDAEDRIILRIFDHWPGYPPYWNYLRAIVIARDSNRCQVTGCPSRLELHVHHRQPVSEGGSHSPDNLVSLCVFHHALEPDKGHERIWGSIKTQCFTLVCEHERTNRAIPGKHEVKAHLRRLELITSSELLKLAEFYAFICPQCRCPDLKFAILQEKNKIEVTCPSCEKFLIGPQELTEETGPRLAELLKASRNQGRWMARWDMLSERKGITWGTWTGARITRKREEHRDKVADNITKPNCPKCNSPMKIIRPKPSDRWKPFWGCTQFRVTGCKGSASYVESRGS